MGHAEEAGNAMLSGYHVEINKTETQFLIAISYVNDRHFSVHHLTLLGLAPVLSPFWSLGWLEYLDNGKANILKERGQRSLQGSILKRPE